MIWPVETGCFQVFSRAASSSGSDTDGDPEHADGMRRDAFSVLLRGMGIAMNFWVVCVSLVPLISLPAVRLLYGEQWAETDAPAVFPLYMLDFALASVNGFSESFFQATASSAELAAGNSMTMLISVASTLLSSWAVQRVGCAGVVVCSILNLILRIGYSLVFIRKYQAARYPGMSLSEILPATSSVCVCVAALAYSRAFSRAL